MPEPVPRFRLGRMKQPAAFAAAFALLGALTVASGAMHGRMRGRWGRPEDVLAAAERLAAVPEQIGDWQLQQRHELDDTAIRLLDASGWVLGSYTHRRTGETVSLNVIVGTPANIAAHPPEDCFGGRYFTQLGPRQAVEILRAGNPSGRGGPASDRYWMTDFRSTRPDRRVHRIYYAYSTGGPWLAAERPRWTHAGAPYLYSIQVRCVLPPGHYRTGPAEPLGAEPPGAEPPPDTAHEFLQAAAPILADYLQSPHELNEPQ